MLRKDAVQARMYGLTSRTTCPLITLSTTTTSVGFVRVIILLRVPSVREDLRIDLPRLRTYTITPRMTPPTKSARKYGRSNESKSNIFTQIPLRTYVSPIDKTTPTITLSLAINQNPIYLQKYHHLRQPLYTQPHRRKHSYY